MPNAKAQVFAPHRIYSRSYPIDIKFDMCVKSVKNIQSNGYIFKIRSNVNNIE